MKLDKRVIVWFGFSVFFLVHLLPAFSEEQLVDRVVVVVNQEIITQSEFDALFQPIYLQYQNTYQGNELTDKLNEVRKKLLNQLIEDKLVLQEARKLGVEVSDNEVDERLGEFKKQFSGQSFDEMLKTQNVKIKTIKDRIRDQISIQKLHYVEIQRKVVVSPIEIKKFYEDHPDLFIDKEKIKVWVIAIPKNPDAIRTGTMDETAKKKAELVLKELKKGKDFSEVAKNESRDAHAKDGGLIGYIARGDMIGKIDEVLFRLKDNDITDVLESEQGYHIFKVADHQMGKTLTLEESRDRIHDMLYRQKANERFQAWMEELKKSAYISIR